MIKRIVVGLFVLCISIPLMAQEEAIKLDTIFMLNRKKLVVQVRNISSSTVRYTNPATDETIMIERKQIEKIVFSNGRKEVFNKPIMMMVDEGAYQTVIVTDKKSDVEGLYEYGTIETQSSAGSRSAKAAKKSALIRMQKKAILLGAAIVYVTKEESIGGFGEPPTFSMVGIAYGYEPPKVEEKEEEKKEQ